jgi:hypothetical protein
MSNIDNSRFRALAKDAFQGLQEFYPAVLIEKNRKAIYEAIEPKYAYTGNRQNDYETLRDAVEAEAKRMESEATPSASP